MSNTVNKKVIAGLMTLSAWASAADLEYGQTVPSRAQAGDLSLAPCQIYLEGDDRHYAGDCGTLVVPENRKDSQSRLIALPVRRIKATGDAPLEPIFWFEGGPGIPNINLYPSDGLLERHDFVMVGYRGIDGQVVLECPEVGQAIRAAKDNLLNQTGLLSLGRGTAACGQRIRATGVDLDGYSMNQTVDDMEAARTALGYDRINLFGNSYGTRVEMIYQWRYPDSIHRVVMVAVNPPGRFIWDPADTDELLDQYAALCAADAHCSARTADLVETMKAVARRMPKSWMGFSVDPVAVRFITFVSLMESMQSPGDPIPLNGPAAIDLWLDAAEGDASGMALVSLLAPFMLPELGERGHLLAMGTSAQDYLDPNRDYRAELTQPDAIIGAPFSLFVWAMAQGWPASSDQSYVEAQNSDIETLLVSGTLDGSTPMRYARDELLPHLRRGHHVIVQGQGHTETFWNSQPQARARLLTTFFATGQVDASLYQDEAPVFAVDTSWGGLAKMLLLAAVVAFAIAAFLLVVIIRKIHRMAFFRKSAQH